MAVCKDTNTATILKKSKVGIDDFGVIKILTMKKYDILIRSSNCIITLTEQINIL